MDNRQLNLNQPLLSVRRGSSMPENNLHSKPTLPPLPYYKSDLKSGPIRNPGVVPFQWEQMPGRPKHKIILPKDSTHAPKLPPGRIKTPQDVSSPGDPLSRVDSFYNCSVSGLSTWPRNVHRNDEDEHEKEEDDDDEDEYDEMNDMSAKLCGLLPKFCILNPIPGIRDHSQAISSVRSVRTRPVNAESCRKTENKQDRRNNHVGDMKRLQHQPAPKNEPPRNAISGRRSLTLIKSRSPQMVLDKEKRFLSLSQECRDLEISKLDLHNHGGTPNHAIEKTLYVNEEPIEQSRNLNSGSTGSRGRNPSVDSLQDIKSISGWDEKQVYQPKRSDSSVISFQDILQKERNQEKGLLALVPALPKSPSESWLSRTLPSMSTKNPTSKSYLGNLAYKSSPVNAKCGRMSRSPNLQHTVFTPTRELGPILEN